MSANGVRLYLSSVFLVVWTTFLYLPTATIDRLSVEDGPIETASALCWIIASGLMGTLFFRTRIVWYLLLALIFFLCFGEEISWGQRIVGFSSPDYFAEHNLQGEFNIHNLDLFDRRGTLRPGPWQNFFSLGRMFSLFWFSYFCALPRIVGISSLASSLTVWARLPVIPPFFGPFLVGNYAVFKYYEILHPKLCNALGCVDRASASNLLGETREFYEAMAILLITIWEFYEQRRCRELSVSTIPSHD